MKTELDSLRQALYRILDDRVANNKKRTLYK